MFKKILIANRGEIALRVICACKELGIPSVAVYSEADRDSLHVRFADQSVCIGPPRSSDSYLNIPRIISTAEITNADAVHPGYGFLSENPNFAEVCETSQLTFIGPRPEIIRLMGEKDRARQAMKEAGLPIIPGSDGAISTEDDLHAIVRDLGYPVLIKAVAGGGGRGMRIVHSQEELEPSWNAARHEAGLAFGNSDVYIERFIDRPRHIEFQVLGDRHGRVVHLGERECSIQRRHQKLVEESPSPRMDADLRRQTGRIVVKAMEDIGYTNAGTIEFLMDEQGRMYFIEMNTRIQVEHPVTEMVTNIDLVKAQIMLADGADIATVLRGGNVLVDGGVQLVGHAIECRINAENPETFTPSAGKITALHLPGGTGVRVDTFAYSECVIPPYYDSLIAKLIVRGRDRGEAISRMSRALEMFIVQGIYTSIPLQQKIMHHPDFISGNIDTKFIERLNQ
jgi:acetyl-CoA carboxylase biotin carboxylase subunit